MTNENKCLMSSVCKKAGDPKQCNDLCFPYIRMHGETGKGGLVGSAGIPKTYRTCLPSNLPFKEDNTKAYSFIKAYCEDVINQVDSGTGLYLHGVPNDTNPKGCGNGKTTGAVAILNWYLIQRVILEAKKKRRIDDLPAIFMNVSKFQNSFNAMFRGSRDRQDKASEEYYSLKDLMKKIPLLVMDDIGVRNATESFKSEFYEIIDDRDNEGLATIYTSNVTIDGLADILDERIASRIEGATIPLPFFGKDQRKRGI